VAAGFSVNLVHGVTGSGKTEIYLQCIRRAVEAGKQAIVLVPEIALTPQTVRRFTARFPRVAVVHSGMSAGQRHRYWHQISSGWAQVVVGARSAIFAPVPNLGIIVVDEEHESSYKQDSAPRYHARDVAIKRAQLESACAILGSATPAMETYHRVRSRADALAETGAGARREVPYALLRLPVRVHGGAMPKVEVIDMKEEARQRRGVHLISRRLEHSLHECLQQKHQSIVLLNRRGYSNFIHCASCDNLITCKYCDKTMTYHRSQEMHTQSASIEKSIHTGLLHCHYCLAVQTLPAACPACGKKLSLFGLGTQRVEEELQRLMPNLRFARVDSDSMRSSKDYATVLDRFGRGEIDCLLGTQMIAKGLDFPNVTLVGVISGDTALALPDFRAAERTFQLITQVSGRAGRGSALGRVVLQTFLPDDPTIQFAIKQDYEGFAEEELSQRKQVGLPPFARMVRIVMRDQDEQKLQRLAAELATRLVNAAVPDGHRVRVKGPMPCAIGRISGYWRQQIVLSSPDPARLQRILAAVREKGGLTKSDRVAVDVDPVSLL